MEYFVKCFSFLAGYQFEYHRFLFFLDFRKCLQKTYQKRCMCCRRDLQKLSVMMKVFQVFPFRRCATLQTDTSNPSSRLSPRMNLRRRRDRFGSSKKVLGKNSMPNCCKELPLKEIGYVFFKSYILILHRDMGIWQVSYLIFIKNIISVMQPIQSHYEGLPRFLSVQLRKSLFLAILFLLSPCKQEQLLIFYFLQVLA